MADELDAFTGEIRAFAFNFAPKGWLFCNGTKVDIDKFQALYSIIGNKFGGNGQTDFMLPDLRSRAVASFGTPLGGNAGLESTIGSTWGESFSNLSSAHLPSHTHQAHGFGGATNEVTQIGEADHSAYLGLLRNVNVTYDMWSQRNANGNFNGAMIGSVGASQPHINNQPYIVLNYCICYNGIYPERS